MFLICPTIEDPMVVCSGKADLQRAVDCLGCRTLAEVSAKLLHKRQSLHADYGTRFRPFFAWVFELGKAIAAMNNNANSSIVRSVPLAEGLPLLEVAIGPWPLLPKLKAFCTEKFAPQPLNKDLWMQIGRFVEMVRAPLRLPPRYLPHRPLIWCAHPSSCPLATCLPLCLSSSPRFPRLRHRGLLLYRRHHLHYCRRHPPSPQGGSCLSLAPLFPAPRTCPPRDLSPRPPVDRPPVRPPTARRPIIARRPITARRPI